MEHPIKQQFLIALQYGGVMEHPEIIYCKPEIIEAVTTEEAVKIYNIKNKCDYYYSGCLGNVVDGKITISVDDLMSLLKG